MGGKRVQIIEVSGIKHKKCPHCGRLLPLSDFAKNASSKYGVRSWCKNCVNSNTDPVANKLRCKQYYETTGRELTKQRKENNIQLYLYQSAKSRANQKGIEFSISVDDILVPDVCPILGIPLKYNRGIKEDNSYSLDRINPAKGYVKGNIWVISLRANRIKNDSTPQELRLIADKVEKAIKSQSLSLSTME